MQAQLISKGTVFGCGEGDQGASHGKTSSAPKASLGAHVAALSGRWSSRLNAMRQPP
jgi:hypothetical protein